MFYFLYWQAIIFYFDLHIIIISQSITSFQAPWRGLFVYIIIRCCIGPLEGQFGGSPPPKLQLWVKKYIYVKSNFRANSNISILNRMSNFNTNAKERKLFEYVTFSWQHFMSEQVCFDWCNLNRHWKMFQSVPWISVMYTTIKSRCDVPQSPCGSRGSRQLRQQATWASIDCVYVE